MNPAAGYLKSKMMGFRLLATGYLKPKMMGFRLPAAGHQL